jgi:hypothetical protein
LSIRNAQSCQARQSVVERSAFDMSKKLRNRFIALVCLLVFAGAGFLFYNNWVVQRPFAVILFVGDGLTTGMLAPARIYHDGAQNRLELERLPHLALLTTYANDFAVPDAAAAASALATGRKVNNRVLSLDTAGKPLASLVDLAQKGGRAVGLVSDSALTGPTLAAFYAKSSNPADTQDLASQLAGALRRLSSRGQGRPPHRRARHPPRDEAARLRHRPHPQRPPRHPRLAPRARLRRL